MSKQPNEDLFEGTTMTFGEHLDELRVVLFRSLIGLLVCVILGFFVAKEVVKKIQGPLRQALETHYLKKAKKDTKAKFGGEAPEELLNLIEERQMIPEPAFLDVEMLVTRLGNELPNQFSGLKFERYQFALKDFSAEGSSKFCSDVIDDKDDSNDGASVLWGLLSDKEKAKFQTWSQESLEREARIELLAIMNRLIEKREIYDADAFSLLVRSATEDKDTAPTEATLLKQAKKETLDAETTRRLNRFLLALAFKKHFSLPQPLLIETPLWRPISIRIQTLNAHEAFMIWLKAAFLSGLVMASPWIFYQVWTFVGAGLYQHERKYVFIYLPFSLLLFLAGASMAFFFVFEHVLNFLFTFNEAMEIDPDPRISEWLSFVLLLPVGFGIAFQLPLGMLFLYRMGIFTVEVYLAKWRLAILIIFVLSMLLTPADPISMLLMAVPLTLLYFLGIAMCRWLPRNRNPFQEGYDPT